MNKKHSPKINKKFGSIRRKYPLIYHSAPINFDITKLEEPMHRAEIVIQGLDMSVFSYEGRIFLNNVNATQETALSLQSGYVGSYHVFSLGGVFIPAIHKKRDIYDYRQSQSPLLKYKRIIVTDALKILAQKTNKFIITIVPVLPGTGSNVFDRPIIQFDRIGITIR